MVSLICSRTLFIVVVVVVGSAVDGKRAATEHLAPNRLAVLDDGDVDHVRSVEFEDDRGPTVANYNADVRSTVVGYAINDRVVDAVGRATKHVPNPDFGYAQVNSHGAFSLQGGCRCVNNSWTDFSRNKFHANHLDFRSWHANC